MGVVALIISKTSQVGLAQRQKDLERSLAARFDRESAALRAAVSDAEAAATAAAAAEQRAVEEKEEMAQVLVGMEAELIEVER